jgi:periplasmic divalent cation tolerance protein
MSSFLLVVTTVGNRDEARRIARALVERGLAACAQISAIESHYAWQGAIEHDDEFRVLFKVAASAYETVERAIRELHSYELPAIHAIPVERAWEPYRAWVEANSRPAADTAASQGAVDAEGGAV